MLHPLNSSRVLHENDIAYPLLRPPPCNDASYTPRGYKWWFRTGRLTYTFRILPTCFMPYASTSASWAWQELQWLDKRRGPCWLSQPPTLGPPRADTASGGRSLGVPAPRPCSWTPDGTSSSLPVHTATDGLLLRPAPLTARRVVPHQPPPANPRRQQSRRAPPPSPRAVPARRHAGRRYRTVYPRRGLAPPGPAPRTRAEPARCCRASASLRAHGAPARSGRAAPPRPVSHPAWERVAGSAAATGTRRAAPARGGGRPAQRGGWGRPPGQRRAGGGAAAGAGAPERGPPFPPGPASAFIPQRPLARVGGGASPQPTAWLAAASTHQRATATEENSPFRLAAA
ncbi:translation initiation factor IF-2-like [Falco biarmicus]|uniref:translation initiation factor IF-2-like n=1 Tax=Falco biarmicus TaxID=345155 RepID=UPI0024BC6302|nr:translation initiation factor IF-2-like [Falco biarmicus]